jgi:transmembrane sensor
MRESAQSIEATALDWVIRQDRGLTEAEHSDLDSWLEGDARRSGAFTRAQLVWGEAARARVYHPADRITDLERAQSRHRLPVRISVAAATLVVSVLSGLFYWQHNSWKEVRTAVGELRQVRLDDGSSVTLETGSHVSVRYEHAARLIRLDAGEALFEVAKDPGRPFVVEAGHVRVRALGTAFIIRRHANEVTDVTVTSGLVEVWQENAPDRLPVRLGRGNQTRITPATIEQPVELTPSQLSGAVNRSKGFIDLNGRTLGEAAAELNRFNQLQIVIHPGLAAQPVVGRFQTTDPAAFVNAAASMLGARVTSDGEHLILEPAGTEKK